jgi:hypothetical protein
MDASQVPQTVRNQLQALLLMKGLNLLSMALMSLCVAAWWGLAAMVERAATVSGVRPAFSERSRLGD